MRRALRLVVVLSVGAALAAVASPALGAAPDPIVGVWKYVQNTSPVPGPANELVGIQITITGAGASFNGTVTTGPKNTESNCRKGGQGIWQITKSGGKYTGMHTGFSVGYPDCKPDPTYKGEWTVGEDTLEFCFEGYTGAEFCWAFERVGGPPIVVKTWPAGSYAGKAARLEYWVGGGSGSARVTITANNRIVSSGSVGFCDSSGCPVSGGRAARYWVSYTPPVTLAGKPGIKWCALAAYGKRAPAKSCSVLAVTR